jgi:hypothetical protein
MNADPDPQHCLLETTTNALVSIKLNNLHRSLYWRMCATFLPVLGVYNPSKVIYGETSAHHSSASLSFLFDLVYIPTDQWGLDKALEPEFANI